MADPQRVRTLLILGGTGDLAERLLLPGLARVVSRGRAPGLTVIGSGSREWTREQWQDRMRACFAEASEAADESGAEYLADTVERGRYLQLDLSKGAELADRIRDLEPPLAVYFALPPALAVQAVGKLQAGDLPPDTRLVLEKPFGSDQASAVALNEALARLVPEENIFRVDHFLGMTTVMDILGLRFTNRLLEPAWSNLHIEKMEIVFDEQLGLEGRAKYYDSAGALKDMIQSHLLHIMAFMAIEAPATLGERDLRDLVAATLRASVADPAASRRARYTAGSVDGREIEAYADSPGVDPSRGTETLAEVDIRINNDRWAGVPFILRSGKAMSRARKEVLVTFRPVSHLPEGFTGITDLPSRLRISFGPAEIELELNINGPQSVFRLERTGLKGPTHVSHLTPYGEVIESVLNGDPLLSVRADIAAECWRIVDPVLQAWAADEVPMESYPAGTQGPPGWNTSRADL
ncbi:glucose-6-phosphate dehydrogenase [Arthrobacter sp. zg-Y40]|uniref:glucose-6-phosphate dehydrogenase n=1 Tax=Arthrobacter sp. zg-Y40 TaxID=2886939 RepID=UPI001D14961B|nr:glucose-6-phosphate dehydrogenase [Arthrobacter sp. zg-Y40]MCC3278940.1 glucose-6-phosphate dehydrogenase [Arthrobacter sp. zg-Y40]